MPQKDKEARKEYNRQLYLKRKQTEGIKPVAIPETITEVKTEVIPEVIDNTFYLLRFFKQIQIVNNEYQKIQLKPIKLKLSVKELMDICINDIKDIKPKKRNLMLIELKETLKNKKLTGNCYKTVYISKLNDRYLKENTFKRVDRPYIDLIITGHPYIKNWLIENHYDYLTSKEQSEKLEILKCHSYTPNKYHNMKIKYAYKTINYNRDKIDYHSVLNMKSWDKKTKKTSNKGCKATDLYTYNDEITNHKKGWKFNGLKIDDLKSFCYQNGLDKIKSKNYQYGDFTEWVLHTLE